MSLRALSARAIDDLGQSSPEATPEAPHAQGQASSRNQRQGGSSGASSRRFHRPARHSIALRGRSSRTVSRAGVELLLDELLEQLSELLTRSSNQNGGGSTRRV